MTTPIVQSISDEQLAELFEFADGPDPDDLEVRGIQAGLLRALIARLRAAEDDARRLGGALSEILSHVDLNIRPTVRDIINGIPCANDIYDFCDAIDHIALNAMEHQP